MGNVNIFFKTLALCRTMSYICAMIKEEKTDKLEVRLTKKMKTDLQKLAEVSKRELSDYLRLLYQNAIDKKIKL